MASLPRIPFTTPLPSTHPRPPSACTLPGAITATTRFLLSHPRTLLLTGAGISVASGLSDYRGRSGTYITKPHYRPIFFTEFTTSHLSRQRYWARSYFGWPVMAAARPNPTHLAIHHLINLGRVRGGLITQNVDGLHSMMLRPVELHGALRHVGCLSCGGRVPRWEFQRRLEALNPMWRELGVELRGRQAKVNPDGDVDLEGVDYGSFRYPACRQCAGVEVDGDGAHVAIGKAKGVMKPTVTFFGESVQGKVREEADRLVRECDAVVVLGSSLATLSAWRLVKDAKEAGKGVGLLNLGGVRQEGDLFGEREEGERLRVQFPAGDVLNGVVKELDPGWELLVKQSYS